jgi:hypothetical protein
MLSELERERSRRAWISQAWGMPPPGTAWARPSVRISELMTYVIAARHAVG